MTAIRCRLADALDRVAIALWSLAHRLRPADDGPRCPDCGIGPDVGPDCPICAESWERQQREDASYRMGYEDGWRGAEGQW